MAAEVFKKGNMPRTVQSIKAGYYAVSAITSGTVIAANVNGLATITVPFKFQGTGPVRAFLLPNDVLDTGLALGNATLVAPASGSYSAGNHPRVEVDVVNVTSAVITTAAAHDLLIVQT